MTIIEAISKADALKFNNYSMSEKIEWLAKLDAKIKTKIIDTHERVEEENEENSEANVDTELLVETPFDDLYIYWLCAQIDYNNGEIEKYNNSYDLFNTAYIDYERWYNRTHKPKGSKLKLI